MALAGPTWQSQSTRLFLSTPRSAQHSNSFLILRVSCTCKKGNGRNATAERISHGVSQEVETLDRGADFSGGISQKEGKTKGKSKLKAQSIAANGAVRMQAVEEESRVEDAVPVAAHGTVDTPATSPEVGNLVAETRSDAVDGGAKSKKMKGKHKAKSEAEPANGVADTEFIKDEDIAGKTESKVEVSSEETATESEAVGTEAVLSSGKSKKEGKTKGKNKAKPHVEETDGAGRTEGADIEAAVDPESAEKAAKVFSEEVANFYEELGGEAVLAGGKQKKGGKAKGKSKAKEDGEARNGAAKTEVVDSDDVPDVGSAVNAVDVEKPKHMVPLQQLVVQSIQSLQGASEKQLQRLGVDPDESVIHDLRVALRRLRSALNLFTPFVVLPSDTRPEISRLLRILGSIRDADVMLETLATVKDAAGELQKDEAKSFEAIKKEMIDERGSAMATASKWLRNKRTSRLLEELHAWVEDPKFSPKVACLMESPTCFVVPSLLTPHAAELLLDSAWHISNLTVDKSLLSSLNKREEPAEEEKAEKVNLKSLVTDHEDFYRMHDLRKLMREMRYRLELLQPVYAGRERFTSSLANLQKLQSVLGDLQDLHILSAYLRRRFRGESSHIARAIMSLHEVIWDTWLETRGILGSPAGHQQLYRAISLTKGPKSPQQPVVAGVVASGIQEDDGEGMDS